MVKSVVSIICVAVILIAGAVYENDFVYRQFKEFETVLEITEDKFQNMTAVTDDAVAVQKNWHDKKQYLHIFIPHNEIKEIELWLAETIIYTKNGQYQEALAKVVVLKELSKEIPKNFMIRLENIL